MADQAKDAVAQASAADAPLGTQLIIDPKGNIVTLPHTFTSRTYVARGTSPVPSANYAFVLVKHFKLSTLPSIPLDPTSHSPILATRTAGTSDWTVPANSLIVLTGDLNLQHVFVAWNYRYNGSTIGTLDSIDVSMFVPQ